MNNNETIKKWVDFSVEVEHFVTNPPMAGAEIRVPPTHVEAAQVLMFHWGRGFRTYRSIHLLVISGFPDDAMVLLRVFLEILFEMAFIAKHPEDSGLYLENGKKTEIAWWRKIRKVVPDEMYAAAGFSEAVLASEIEDTKEKERKAPKSAWHPKYRSVRQRAIEAGAKPFLYDLVYSLASRYIHGSGDWMHELACKEKRGIRINYTGSPKEGALAAMFANVCVVEQLEILNSCLDLKAESQLNKLRENLNALCSDEWKQAIEKYE